MRSYRVPVHERLPSPHNSLMLPFPNVIDTLSFDYTTLILSLWTVLSQKELFMHREPCGPWPRCETFISFFAPSLRKRQSLKTSSKTGESPALFALPTQRLFVKSAYSGPDGHHHSPKEIKIRIGDEEIEATFQWDARNDGRVESLVSWRKWEMEQSHKATSWSFDVERINQISQVWAGHASFVQSKDNLHFPPSAVITKSIHEIFCWNRQNGP